MENLLLELELALKSGMYQTALFTCLTLPDVCGSLDSKTGETNSLQAIAWFDKHLGNIYSGSMSGKEYYSLRCSVSHQGRFQTKKKRFVFVLPTIQANLIHQLNHKLVDGSAAVTLDVVAFCGDIIDAVRLWLKQVDQTALFQTNHDKFITYYPKGLFPFFGGSPVIA